MLEIINKLKERQAFLEKTIKLIETREPHYPEGTVRIRTENNRGIYYHIVDKKDTNGVYISRKEDDFARKLAQKEYERNYKKHATSELKAINRFMSEMDKYNCNKCYSKLSTARKELIKPFEISDMEYAKKWKSITYEGLKFREDDTTNYITDAGERVRSKSELVIANLLYKNNIPYKYECPLNINNNIIYPDFTVLNARKRKVIYWEHFGMMGDTEYSNNAIRKIVSYSKSNILIGDRLITTFETANNSIDLEQLNKLIRCYFHS